MEPGRANGGWRSATPRDSHSLDQLCSEGFGLSEGQSFFDDFPIWDIRRPIDGRLIEVMDGPKGSQILSQLGSVRRTSLTEPDPLTLVGAVVTRSSVQGRGLARSGLDHLLRKTEAQGARSWLLWTGDDRLYRSMGFKAFGSQWRTTITKISGNPPSGQQRVRRGWSPDFTAFLAKRTRGLQMSEAESGMLRNLKNVDWWSLRSPGEQLIAVAGIGKGIDLGGILHDWHGSEAALRTLFVEIARELPETTLLYGSPLFAEYPWLKQLKPEFEDPLCYWRGEPPSRPDELWFWGCDSC